MTKSIVSITKLFFYKNAIFFRKFVFWKAVLIKYAKIYWNAWDTIYFSRPLLLIFLSLIFLLLGVSQYREILVYDEGLAAVGAERVLRGEVPYRDFWTLYGPAQFYLIGAIFKIFGSSIMVLRLYDVLVRFLLTIIIYWIAKRLTSAKIALVPWIFSVVMLGSSIFFGYPMYPAQLFSLLSLLFTINFFKERKISWLVLSGLSVGISSLFRFDVGIFSFFAESLLVAAYTFSIEKNNKMIFRLRKTAKVEIMLLFAFLLPVVPVLVILLNIMQPELIWNTLIIFPLEVYYKVRSLPLPPLFIPSYFSITFYLPLLIYAIVIVQVIRERLSFQNESVKWGILLFIMVGLLSFRYVIARADHNHLIPGSIPALLLLGVLLNESKVVVKLEKILLVVLTVNYFVGVILIYGPTADWKYVPKLEVPACQSHLAKAGCVYVDKDQEKSVEYIQSNTEKSERIYVGTLRHDRIFANDAIFYFLADRNSITKYHELVPGIATTMKVQKEIVDDLNEYNAKFVVLYSGFDDVREPNGSNLSSGVFYLDDYIRENYREVQKFGKYLILERST